MTLRATAYCSLAFDFSGASAPAQQEAHLLASKPIEFQNGTSAGKADRAWAGTYTLAGGGSQDIDLAGSLNDLVSGGKFTAVKVRALYIEAPPGNPADLVVGGAASNTWQGPFNAANNKIRVPPGGRVMFLAPQDGWAVTAGTADILTIANASGGTAASFTIGIVATSA